MRKVFITIPWFLPAFRAGGPIQSIANLVNSNFENVHFFIFTSDTDLHGAALQNIQTNDWVPFNSITHVWYNGPHKTSENLVQQVERIKPDVLYIVGLYSWYFNLVPLIYCKVPVKMISARGMLNPEALREKSWKKKIFIRLFKLMEFQHKVVFHATDTREAAYISRAMGPVARVSIAANIPNDFCACDMISKVRDELKMVSVGLVSPMKNYLLVLEALASVTGRVVYHIYGAPKDEEYWHACRNTAAALPPNIQVHFHREIEPRQVGAVLSAAHVFVLPSKSENFGHAIYEALSCGRPVITSHNTPWNQLEHFGAGLNVDICETASLTAGITRFLSMDFETIREWGKNAKSYSEAALDKGNILENYAKMFALNNS